MFRTGRFLILPTIVFALACALVIASQNGSASSSQSVDNANGDPITSAVSCTDLPYAKPLPPAAPECVKELFARRGRPFMFPSHDDFHGIAYGVSSGADETMTLYLWADNQTDEAAAIYSCCASTLFDHVNVFDSEQHRVPSKTDQEVHMSRSTAGALAEVCSCSAWITLPPHTMEIIDSADLSLQYRLPPGRYTVSERYPAGEFGSSINSGVRGHQPLRGLTISISESRHKAR